MVIPDWTPPKKPVNVEFVPTNSQANVGNMARPVDRLAAVIVDIFVLLVPIFILLSAPFKRWMMASFILGNEPDFISLVGVMTLMAVVLVVSYQASFHFFFGATLGKMLFDLKVKPAFGDERMTFMSCVGRSLVWILEFVCLGLPLLSVFTNSQRRTLHDRVSDTCVVSMNGTGTVAPHPVERGLVRGFVGSCLLFALLVAGVQVHQFFDKMKLEHNLIATFDHESGACEVVDKNIGDEEESTAKPHARLELAMSLYAAGLAERNCLEVELEREIATQTPVGGITYLAQAFVNADDAEVSNSYLDQVCEDTPASVECTMSKVVSRWSDEDWSAVEDLLANATKGSGYLEVWAVRHHMKQAHYQEALAYLDELSDHRELSEFSLVQRVKAYFNSYQTNEAEAALASAIPALPKDDADDISAWVCAQALQNGCAALDKLPCREVPAPKEMGEIDFEHSAVALAKVMSLECHGDDAVDYLTFSQAVKNEDWQTFFRANLKRQKDDLSAAYKLFADVVNSNTTPELLRVEALRRVAQFATTPQLHALVESWRGFESKDSWIKGGNLLFARLMEKKDRDSALRVARYLMNAEGLSPNSVAQLTGLMTNEKGDRMPASVRPKENIHTIPDSYEEGD